MRCVCGCCVCGRLNIVASLCLMVVDVAKERCLLMDGRGSGGLLNL